MQIAPWDWHIWSNVEKIGLAYLLAFPLGLEREHESHSAGIRTFPIVAMASCGYVLTASSLLSNGSPDPASISRMLQGLVAGIGFVGGGAILKTGDMVHGTATAASIWNVGALGAAVALGRPGTAITLMVLNLVTLHLLIPLREHFNREEKSKHSDH